MAATRSEVVRGGGGGADPGARFWARHALTRGAEATGEPAVPKVLFLSRVGQRTVRAGGGPKTGIGVGRRGVGAKNITILAEMLLKLRFLWSFHLFYHHAT
jgi:hypothetical protein